MHNDSIADGAEKNSPSMRRTAGCDWRFVDIIDQNTDNTFWLKGVDNNSVANYSYSRWLEGSSRFFVHTHPQFTQQALLHRGFANERRLFILQMLLQRPRTGQDLVQVLKIRPAAVSKHLRVLMTAGLVYGIREKKSVNFYAVQDLVRRYFIA